MKIMIDVSDTLYKTCKRLVSEGDPRPSESCIANGIPLPKGHGRLIDADALLAHLEEDTREAFTKHQVWLMFSVYNEDVPTVVEADYSKEEK